MSTSPRSRRPRRTHRAADASSAPSVATDAEPAPVHDIDRALHAQMARFTQGLSPASLFGAWADWLMQSFLLNQQWWHNATTGVRGVSHHHEQVVNFAARQWLDLVSPSNFLFSNPEVLAETLKTGGANLWQGARNWMEDAARLAAGQPPAGTELFRPGHEVALTPGKVVLRNHLIELIQYAPRTATVYAEPVLIVPSWIMKYYILDLSPGNSLVRSLVEQGHTVFIVSWRNPDAGDRGIGMDDYLDDGVMAAFDAVSAIVPERRIHGLGYCLGGTLLAIAAAAMARDGDERLHTATLLASLVDFTDPGELGLFIDESQVAYLNDVMSEQGYLDGRQMAGAFALLNTRDLVFSRVVHDYLMGRRRPVSDLAAWNADATRMPFHQHSHYLHSLYMHNDLAQGRYVVDGKPVALSDIRSPIFCLGTQRDTVSPWRSVYMVHLLTDTAVTFCLTSGGHNVGVVNPPGPGVKRSYQMATREAEGRHVDPDSWQAQTPSHEGSWSPAWQAWLRRHSGQRAAPPAMGNAAAGYAPREDAPGRCVRVA